MEPDFQGPDEQDFLGSLQLKGQFIRDGFAAGQAEAENLAGCRGLLFSGMGFSGVSANLVKDAATRALDIPFTIVKHYQFPHHVKPGWHTIAVSYSGQTEETLSVVDASLRQGVGVTAFTTGGALAKRVEHVVQQPSGHQPRAALPYTWASILGFLESSRLLRFSVPWQKMVEAVESVDATCGPDVPEDQNEAKQLARKLVQPIPQIYATPAFFGVGLHFRGMLNENAKKIANVELVPECNHNDLTGWGGDADHRTDFAALALSHADQNPQIARRLDFMGKKYTEWGVPWHHKRFEAIHTFEDHVVEQARALQFLDYTSYYIAMLRKVDPSKIVEIQALKKYLSS